MKSVCLFVVLCGVACALAAPTDATDKFINTPTVVVPETNVVKYVRSSHRASLNFACNIDRITVKPNFDSFAVGFEDPLTQIELEDHLGEPTNIEWAHVPQMFFEGIDSRGQDRELATLGGDLGEFLIVLAAAEAQTGKVFTKGQVLQQFKIYLTVMSRDKFYFSTDSDGVDNLKKACGCPQLNIADPPEGKRAILHNATHEAASHGDEFFKKVLDKPELFNIRAELVHHLLDAFFDVMWLKSDPLHRRIKFVLMKGPVASKGFVMIKTPGYCNAQLLAPMISPELCGKQMGIYHGDAAVLLRTEIAGIVMSKSPEDKNAVVVKANELASAALTAVLADHQEPVYTVSFEGF
eukprot:c11797_g1_i1.p1 GENE.c11797_g1_i1~~c11797_g1_i1.p1  ORF type:complete len:369 (+),score=90.50 c11797_g1_i1:53-1108(+)